MTALSSAPAWSYSTSGAAGGWSAGCAGEGQCVVGALRQFARIPRLRGLSGGQFSFMPRRRDARTGDPAAGRQHADRSSAIRASLAARVRAENGSTSRWQPGPRGAGRPLVPGLSTGWHEYAERAGRQPRPFIFAVLYLGGPDPAAGGPLGAQRHGGVGVRSGSPAGAPPGSRPNTLAGVLLRARFVRCHRSEAVQCGGHLIAALHSADHRYHSGFCPLISRCP